MEKEKIILELPPILISNEVGNFKSGKLQEWEIQMKTKNTNKHRYLSCWEA